MGSLPGDAILNILCRLSVKDLLRYRCVSKPWCSLIDDPHFVRTHLEHSMETDSNLSLIRGDRELHSIDVDTLDSAIRLNPVDVCGVEILGCFNGLLVLTNSIGDMAIWNPSTRRYKMLLLSDLIENPFPNGIIEFGIAGFGYDSVNDDHKLLRMIHYFGVDIRSFRSEIKVYSLKYNTWKRVGDFPYRDGYKHHGIGVFVSGSLHWMVTRESQSYASFFVVAFDFATEEYREISLPEKKASEKEAFYTNLAPLGGWLCMVCIYSGNEKADHVDIWAMKEYGVKESWTKLVSVFPSSVTGPFDYATPLVYFKNARQLLLDQGGEKFMLYDLKKNTAKSVIKISDITKCFDTFVCVRSLVGLGGGKRGSKGKKAEENGNKRKKQEQQLRGRKR
ncbi:F-box protein CPR1-like [Humulus lupulus]|uniref:F-box protein CPR1-like n=1 Tax=Humulus lupulus TaxID=3486 RepID=UPI002B4163F7|nr:F-box protein CPR1-like [Humulus lupulus]